MKETNKQMSKHRVITLLNREEMDFLDRLGKDALFSTGRKLSYNEILEGLVDFAEAVGLSGEGIRTIEDLKRKIIERMKKGEGNETH